MVQLVCFVYSIYFLRDEKHVVFVSKRRESVGTS